MSALAVTATGSVVRARGRHSCDDQRLLDRDLDIIYAVPMPRTLRITSLPSRYEPLIQAFGDKAKTTFIAADDDLTLIKRLLARAESAGQGKILFISAPSGSGKSTLVQSVEIFLPDEVARVVRLAPPHEMPVDRIPSFLSQLPVEGKKFTIVNFDGREAPSFNEPEYKNFLGQLNGILRIRRDLIILWPVTDYNFAERIVNLLSGIGGQSAFGNQKIHRLNGLRPSQFKVVMERILNIANWKLEDAAITATDVDAILTRSTTIGNFLDQIQDLIAQRFDVEDIGISFPRLIIAISSGADIREICRSLRRADSFYIEASRLLMYTKKSNVAEWWQNRATDLRSALPHVVALFDAQLVSLSAASVVHSVLLHGTAELKQIAADVQSNRGAAVNVISSAELFKLLNGDSVDNRAASSGGPKKETIEAYHRLQGVSDTHHKAINKAILETIQDAGAALDAPEFEKTIRPGLMADVVLGKNVAISIEFHHKQADESVHNKISIYILEKLKEYAINYGLAQR